MGATSPLPKAADEPVPPSPAEAAVDEDPPVPDLGQMLGPFMDPKNISELQWLQQKNVEFYKEMWPAAVKVMMRTLREVGELRAELAALRTKLEGALKK